MLKEIVASKVETTLKKWYIKAGDEVHKGDALCTVKLGNINREVSSKFNGTITEIMFQPESVVPGAAVICKIEVEENKKETIASVPAGTEVQIKVGKVASGKATIKEWCKSIGDIIKAGETIAVIVDGKLNKELTSVCGGELIWTGVELNAEVGSDDVIAIVRSDGTAIQAETDAPKTKVVVVGGGPGGYVAAIRAAQLNADVTLVEKSRVGGTCLNVGCIPTKALMHSAEIYKTATNSQKTGITAENVHLNWDQVQNYRQEVSDQLVNGVQGLLAANGVEVIEGTASFSAEKSLNIVKNDGTNEERTADKIILATGSTPFVPPIPGIGENENCIDSTGALTLKTLPESMVIIGGGVIGIELACAYAAFGTKITVVEMMSRIMPVMDYELTLEAQKMMEKQGIEFSLETQVNSVEQCDRGIKVLTTLKSGESKIFEAEKVLVAVGRRSSIASLNVENAGIKTERSHIVVNEKMETNVPDIYAIGDCVGKIMLAHAASAMGEVAAENALGKKNSYDEHICPSCVYMFPEFAGVGLNQEQIDAKGYKYKVGKFPMVANGKSVIMEETQGWVKILSDQRTGKILGVHILGARATDLIAEATMAMQMHASVKDVIHMIHAHPTVAEAIHEAALAVENRAIHFK